MPPRPLPPNRRILFCPANFQSLSPRSERGTNCPPLPTLSAPFSFQQLTTIKFCNSFPLIIIRIARGVDSPPFVKRLGKGAYPSGGLPRAVRHARRRGGVGHGDA